MLFSLNSVTSASCFCSIQVVCQTGRRTKSNCRTIGMPKGETQTTDTSLFSIDKCLLQQSQRYEKHVSHSSNNYNKEAVWIPTGPFIHWRQPAGLEARLEQPPELTGASQQAHSGQAPAAPACWPRSGTKLGTVTIDSCLTGYMW